MKKTLYLVLLAFAFVGAALFYTNLHYQGDAVIVFHIDAFGVTWHHLSSVTIIVTLLILYIVSWLKFLVPSSVAHKTEIMRK